MDVLTGKFGPREIALAIAFGVLIGLIPKANLLVAVLLILFFFSRANLLVGVLAIAMVGFFASWIHPAAHRLGLELLVSDFGQQWGAKLFQYPFVAWTMLDNTVVLGSFLIGMALFPPVFLGAWILLKVVWPRSDESRQGRDETSPARRTDTAIGP